MEIKRSTYFVHAGDLVIITNQPFSLLCTISWHKYLIFILMVISKVLFHQIN